MPMARASSSAVFAALLAPACAPTGVERLVHDTFVQGGQEDVDVLFVVDDTASMPEIQATFAAQAATFLEPVLVRQDLQFHVGVTTTDWWETDRRGRLVAPWLDRTTATPAALQAALTPGGAGSLLERGVQSAWAALTPPLATHENRDFHREGARIVVISLSDEDDCSDEGAILVNDGAQCVEHPELLVPIETWILRFAELQPDPAAFTWVAIVETGSTDEGLGCGGSSPGTRYMELAARTAGAVFPYCDDAATTMAEVGLLATGYRRAFPLGSTPMPDTLEVRVREATAPEDEAGALVVQDSAQVDGWTFDGAWNAIRFWGPATPPAGAVVQVSYAVGLGL